MALMCEHVVCADGWGVSVQAMDGSYCTPDNANGPMEPKTTVELGPCSYTQVEEEILSEHAECEAFDSVHPYVPVEVVRALIEAHGGMVSGAVPNGVLPGLVPGHFESRGGGNGTFRGMVSSGKGGE